MRKKCPKINRPKKNVRNVCILVLLNLCIPICIPFLKYPRYGSFVSLFVHAFFLTIENLSFLSSLEFLFLPGHGIDIRFAEWTTSRVVRRKPSSSFLGVDHLIFDGGVAGFLGC